MSADIEMVQVSCPLCGGDERDLVYQRVLETGSSIGRIEIKNVMCRDCGLMYMTPRPNPEALTRYYTEESSASGNTYHSTDVGSRHDVLTQERIRFLLRHLDEGRPGLLLDIGCSTGDFLAGLNLAGWQCWGLEPSPYAAAIARGRSVNVICDSIDVASLEPGRFDVICCISTLEHLYDPGLGVSAMVKALKLNAGMMIEVPDSTMPVAQAAEFYSYEHLTHFTLGTLSRLLAKHGVEVESVDREVSVSNLRIWGKKRELVNVSQVLDDREELLRALTTYEAERRELEQSLVERFSSLTATWKRNSSRVAVYGAGMHSLFLLNIIDLEEYIVCFLDSAPKKQGTTFLRWDVYGPQRIDELELDAIIISSKAYQEEMFRSIVHYESQGINIVKCYP